MKKKTFPKVCSFPLEEMEMFDAVHCLLDRCMQRAFVAHIAIDRFSTQPPALDKDTSLGQNRANGTTQFRVVHSQLVCSVVRPFGFS